MKSNKQRRQEIKARRLQRCAKKIRAINARPVDRPAGVAPVATALLRPTNSYGIPDFVQRGYYQDRPFRCKDCGVDEIWTAAQQQWWYEEAQGDVWTIAVRCRACRQRERARKTEARRLHLEGLALKRGRRFCTSAAAFGQADYAINNCGQQPTPARCGSCVPQATEQSMPK